MSSDYPFLDLLWTMLIFFVWASWFVLLFRIIGDVFRRRDIGGGGKVVWMIFVIALPFVGVFVYLVSQNQHMGERDVEAIKASQQRLDDHVQSVAEGLGGPAHEIARAKQLLDTGAISTSEFESMKAAALR